MACPLHKKVPAGKVSVCSRPVLSSGISDQRLGRKAIVACSYESSTSSSTVTTSRAEAGTVKDGTIRVKVTPPREVSQPPSPPSLIHSPVYVQNALMKSSADSTNASLESTSTSSLLDVDMERNARDGNSLLWALKQVDRSLDELEQNPLPLQREIYELSRSPVGTATSSALTTAARVTVAATKEAVKAAVPVGQWVITEGTKAAISFMSRAMAESAKQPGVSASSSDGPGKQAGKNGGIQRK